MNSLHDFPRFIGICNWITTHQVTNTESEDTIEIKNVVKSQSLQKTDHQHLLALPINSGPFENDAAPNMEGSLSQFFNRLYQRVVFNFLTGHGEVEKLLHGLNHQEAIQVPDQQTIFNFLNGDVFQCLIFLVDFDLESSFGSDTCEALSKCLSQLELENSPDGISFLDETRDSMQDNGSCSTVSHELQLTDHHSLEDLTTVPTVKMNGFTEVIDGNIHSECSFSTSNPFFDSPLHYYQKTFKSVEVSDNISSESNQNYLIENLSGILCKSNCGAEVFEQTTTTYQGNFPDFCQHPTNGNSMESTFTIPDPDELFDYLHGTLSSPKFLISDPLNGESDKIQFSLHLGYCTSDEGAKLDNLSDSITNLCGESNRINKEYGICDPLGYAIELEIGAMTGAFGEIETLALLSLPKPSQIKQIRWNWHSRDVDFSHVDFDDHEDLLKLYGIKEQDVQASDDEFCESPTWPGKRFIQESDLEYLGYIYTSVKETDSISEIAGITKTRNITESCSRSYMDSSSDYCCKIVSQVHEERHGSAASRTYYHQSLDDVSDTIRLLRIHNNTAYQYGNTASLNVCGTSGHSFGHFQGYPAIGSDEELKFTIPDPDELMKFLHGSLSSPKFLASDPPNWESDNNHLPSNVGIRSSDEVAKSDNLSGSITNSSITDAKNDSKNSSVSGIEATSGAFEENETHAIPSLPEQSQNEKVRWNWFSRDVDSSCFDFGDHEDLLELYGLNEQDVQENDDEFCDSPTWPGKE